MRYQRNYVGTLFISHGGVLERLLLPALVYLIYCSVLYWACLESGFFLADGGSHLIAGCASFMLVFRLNQCYTRLNRSEHLMVMFLSSLRHVVMLTCEYVQGPELSDCAELRPLREAAVMLKVNVVRLALATAVSLSYHASIVLSLSSFGEIDKEKLLCAMLTFKRIKGLLTGAEASVLDRVCGLSEIKPKQKPKHWGISRDSKVSFAVDMNRLRMREEIDSEGRLTIFGDDGNACSGVALTPVLIQLLRKQLRFGLRKEWGYPERMLNLYESCLSQAIEAFEDLDDVVTQPMPLPYLQLCRSFMIAFLCLYPCSIKLEQGIWGNVVVPTILAMALLGFDIVSAMLENPLSDDPCSLSVEEMLHELELSLHTLFDLSETDADAVNCSLDDLGSALGLPEAKNASRHRGEQTPAPKGGRSAPAPAKVYRFDDFFEWSQLPTPTLKRMYSKYGPMSSTRSWSCCCCPRRSDAQQSNKDPSPSDGEDSSRLRLLHSEFEASVAIKCAYLPRYFLALRVNDEHRTELAALEESLEREASSLDRSTGITQAVSKYRSRSKVGSAASGSGNLEVVVGDDPSNSTTTIGSNSGKR
eukprot:TRINITY_DN3095_c0_g3_i1.p1 TRINITY_DN3095_c0_g3~~TRINITY_DN3095_c0_g3_i1.p1  ORF type:complete len:588 (+),score=123.30 TRINITY_DN3095_c0_g3_i1:29-1792(+)